MKGGKLGENLAVFPFLGRGGIRRVCGAFFWVGGGGRGMREGVGEGMGGERGIGRERGGNEGGRNGESAIGAEVGGEGELRGRRGSDGLDVDGGMLGGGAEEGGRGVGARRTRTFVRGSKRSLGADGAKVRRRNGRGRGMGKKERGGRGRGRGRRRNERGEADVLGVGRKAEARRLRSLDCLRKVVSSDVGGIWEVEVVVVMVVMVMMMVMKRDWRDELVKQLLHQFRSHHLLIHTVVIWVVSVSVRRYSSGDDLVEAISDGVDEVWVFHQRSHRIVHHAIVHWFSWLILAALHLLLVGLCVGSLKIVLVLV